VSDARKEGEDIDDGDDPTKTAASTSQVGGGRGGREGKVVVGDEEPV